MTDRPENGFPWPGLSFWHASKSTVAMDLHNLRREYAATPIDVDSVDPCPFKQFEAWFAEANAQELPEPNAMVVSTVGEDNRPTQRTVLLKYFDKSGFVFFTNYESRKAKQISGNENISLLFPWYPLQRQVEVNGIAEKVSAADSLKYFALRPRGSQLGAWVSQQSSVVSSRSLLQNKLAELKQKFAKGQVPKPPAWGGFRVKPSRIEFWQGGQDRLHDRIEYTHSTGNKTWTRQRLSP